MVYLLLADGFEETEALLPLDILRRGGVEVRTVGITGKTVTGSHGIPVVADLLPADITSPSDMIILPGGIPGATNLDASDEVDKLLSATVRDGKRLAAICAAPMILGRRGLLNGRRAVCFPGFEKELKGATLVSERVVTDGNITTAVGMGAAAEFGFALLTLLKGRETAERVGNAALFAPIKK